MIVILVLMAALLLPLTASAADGPASARRHLAATANPLASEAALSVLREGGSAVDAAIAAQMVLGVVEPQSSGLGGGSILLVWDASRRKLAAFEGLASAPAAFPSEWQRGSDGSVLPTHVLERTGRVIGVPGTLRTLGMIHARYGKLPWPRLFADAIRLADEGFPLAPYLHGVLTQRADLARTPDIGQLYYEADGRPRAVGTVLRNPALAQAMRTVAAEGPDALSRGPLADAILRAATGGANPSAMTLDDLAAYAPRERDPVCGVAFGRRICSAPPPSAGGVAVLQLLAIAERAGIATAAPGSAEAAHLFIEASRLDRADRRAAIGDPDQVGVPVAGLLDRGYLDGRARLVAPDRAMTDVGPGAWPGRHGALPVSDPLTAPATSHVAVVDDAGNAVSLTTTINLNFGADRMAAGFVLNDGLSNFAARSVVDGIRVPNAGGPGKRPVTTMAPTMVFGADGAPELLLGAGGGARIVDSVAQTLVGVLAWKQDVRTAISAPRVGAQDGAEELERRTPAASLEGALRALGHDVHVTEMNAAVQAIAVTPQGLRGWADPRRDGVALGE